MARVLKDGGVVAMCEPGAGHGRSELSKLEENEWGVLENDIFVEDLERLALDCGFTRLTVVPINLPLSTEIPAHRLRDFLLGKQLRPVLEPVEPIVPGCELHPHVQRRLSADNTEPTNAVGTDRARS